jgi:hypothetical protein
MQRHSKVKKIDAFLIHVFVLIYYTQTNKEVKKCEDKCRIFKSSKHRQDTFINHMNIYGATIRYSVLLYVWIMQVKTE